MGISAGAKWRYHAHNSAAQLTVLGDQISPLVLFMIVERKRFVESLYKGCTRSRKENMNKLFGIQGFTRTASPGFQPIYLVMPRHAK